MSIQIFTQEILKTGKYNEAEIAEIVGVTKETIRRFKTGQIKQTNYITYSQILSLYLISQQEQED